MIPSLTDSQGKTYWIPGTGLIMIAPAYDYAEVSSL